MKSHRMIICLLLVAVLVAIGIIMSDAKTSYEITDGAVIFNSSNTVSYLVNGGAVNNLDISYDSGENAAKLVVSGNAADPYALLNYNSLGISSLSADTYKYIVVTEKIPTSASASATTTEVFWAAGSVTGPTGGCSKLFDFTKDGVYHSYVIDMTSVSGWTGTIHSLRLDVFTTAAVGDTAYVDSIVLAKTQAEASTISQYRTAKANGTLSPDDSVKQVIFTSDNYSTYLKTVQIEQVLYGDVDGNGHIASPDVAKLKRYIACNINLFDPNHEIFNSAAADVNQDGRISAKDVLFLKKGIAQNSLGNGEGTSSASISFDNEAGKAVLTAHSAQPYVNFTYLPGDEVYSSQYRYAVITYMATKSGTASIYGITSETSSEDAAAHTFTVNGDGDFHSQIIDFSSDSGWTGTVSGLKIQFFNSASNGDLMKLDSVTFVEKSGAASTIANNREAIANDLNFVETYELDITGQTLGQINTPGTYQNVGYRANEQDVFHPFSASWPGAGYTVTPNVENYNATHSLIVFATYDNCIKIADCVDLSKYNSVTITYGTDQSFGTNQNGAALNSAFGLFSTKTVYGHTGGNNHNENGIICYLNPTAADGTSPSWVTTRTVSKAINSNYVGPLWMSFYHNTGDGAVVTNISFHLKTAVAETIDTTNNQAGSTVYKVSGDGSTISANGKTYENNVNMTNGVTVATDDVRTLRTDRTTENDLPATNGVRGGYDFANKNVGVFYFIWLGAHGKDLYDIQARVNANSLSNRYLTGAAATDDTKTDALWGPGQVHQFFSEPMYGYYYSSDEWVIRRHIEELTNADVDFIFFDVTNGIPYIQNAVKVMQVIHEFNLMGYNPPKVVFYSNDNNSSGTGNITMLQYLWNNIYSQNVYPDTWFCYQGKPVIIGKQIYFNQLSAAIQNFFTFRQSQWPNETNRSRIEGDQTIHYSETDANGYAISDGQGSTYYKKNGGWSWMDFSDLPNPNKYPNGNGYESINVSVAQHLGTVAFGDSGIYDQHCHKNSGKFIFGTGRYNHGRNWRGSSITNDDTGENYKQGYNFQRQWDTVHNTYSDDLPVVLVTGWNEWAAGRQAGAPRTGAHMAWFVDTATVNYSRDIEMTKGYYFDSYYMQLIDNIRKYKGSAPTLVRDQMKRIDVYGSFDQWNDVTTSYRDPTGDQAARNTTGFSNTPYVNNTGRNDLKSCKIVHDTEYIYFYAECASNITPFSAATPWMKIYIDIDQDKSTGWNGYDYAVNYEATGANTTSVASYSSNGTASYVDRNISYSVNGTMIMIKVPLSDLGISDYTNIDFAFKWVDSTTSITTMEQLYTYGDQMPHGRLNFVFTNH